MLCRIYAIPFTAVAISGGNYDLLEITPADDKPCELIGWHIGQTSDSGDAQDEQLQLTVIRGHTTSGSGGSAVTPAPVSPNDAAAGFTAEVTNSTIASTGTTATLFASAWNVRAGSDVWLPEEVRPRVSQAQTSLVVRMGTPADSITTSGVFWVREFP